MRQELSAKLLCIANSLLPERQHQVTHKLMSGLVSVWVFLHVFLEVSPLALQWRRQLIVPVATAKQYSARPTSRSLFQAPAPGSKRKYVHIFEEVANRRKLLVFSCLHGSEDTLASFLLRCRFLFVIPPGGKEAR